MIAVLSCIALLHDPLLVAIAAFVCLAGSAMTVTLFGRARDTVGMPRWGWLFMDAVATGSAVWATHFVAILAYDPGVPITFSAELTIASLLVGVIGAYLGLALSLTRRLSIGPELGGAVLGLSIAGMHYTGMMGLRIDGFVDWNGRYIMASVACAVLLGMATLSVLVRLRGAVRRFGAIGLLTLAIVSLHFTGMTAVTVTTAMLAGMSGDNLNTGMALAIAAVALLVVGTGLASYAIDSRNRMDAASRLRHLALHDSLTGLPNRVNLEETLRAAISDLAADERLAFLAIDLDGFKAVNDLDGHAAGDEVLRIVAERFSSALAPGDMLARVGGDEFVALRRISGSQGAGDLAERLSRSLSEPIHAGEISAMVGASIGIAVFPDDAIAEEDLKTRADLAMYRAKATNGTGVICFYRSDMDEAYRARIRLMSALRQAIAQNEFEIYYQVQTSIETGQITGYEALLRWNTPHRGLVSPSEFIPLAEEMGLIWEIGAWVLREACRTAAAWEQPHRVAVNLSPVQLQGDLTHLVMSTLLETGLPPRRLELEITESAIVADPERAYRLLREIRALGVSIAMDDFGTGYSSLSTLRAFPFDKIKLDGSFMGEIEQDHRSRAVLRAVLALGKSMGVPVLAEGVERDGQLALLRQEGCDEVQGYLLGRPGPEREVMPDVTVVTPSAPVDMSPSAA